MGRYAVIDCEDSPKWADGFSTYLLPAFREDDDEVWEVFRAAAKLELPSLSDKFDGIIVTGSHYNVRDNMPFQAPLVEYLKAVLLQPGEVDDGSKPRVVGICYGHQGALMASLGLYDDRVAWQPKLSLRGRAL